MKIIAFLKEWTLPVAICVGTVSYLTFNYVPQLDAAGNALAPVFDVIFPLFVFLTLLVTFCKVDFHQMLPHRWHTGILIAQLLLVAGSNHAHPFGSGRGCGFLRSFGRPC